MSFLGIFRQSTAEDVLIGPFVDSTDGDSEEGGLTIAQADVRLSKNGQTAAQKNDVTTCAHDADGFYNCELDATDFNTVGKMTLYVHVAGALAVRHDLMVVEEAIYDAYYAASATGLMPANVTQWNGSAVATPTVAGVPEVDVTHLGGVAQSLDDLKDFADAGYDPSTNKVQGVVLTDTVTTYTGNTPQTGDVFPLASTEIADIKAKTDNLPSDPADASVIAGLIAAVEAKVDIVDTVVDAILVDTAEIGAAGAGLTAVADQVWDEDATGHQTLGTFGKAIGDPAANTATIYGEVSANLDIAVSSRSSQSSQDIIHSNVVDIENAVITEIADIKAKTDNLPSDPADASVVAGLIAAVETKVDTVDTVVDAIKAKTDSLTFTGANRVDANLKAVDDETTVVSTLRRGLKGMHEGSVTGAATTTTLIDSTLTQPHTDALKGRIVIFEGNVTAALTDQATDITAFNPSTDQLTFTALTVAPASGDRYTIN